VGEVGLLGELRPVPGLERRLREAARLGFRIAVVPGSRRSDPPSVTGIEVVAVANLREAIGRAVGAGPSLAGNRNSPEDSADAPSADLIGTPAPSAGPGPLGRR
jgi:DNA repair protein RadA/Sms